jgi:hypothetical protein
MSPNDIAAELIGTLLSLVGIASLPRVWRGFFARGDTRFRGRMRSNAELALLWWPFGEATRRGAVRGFVAALFWWCGGTIFLWASYLSANSTGSGRLAWDVVAWIAVAWAMLWFALVLTVMFFNWPKLVVPPPQRGEPGAISEWRSKRPHKRLR